MKKKINHNTFILSSDNEFNNLFVGHRETEGFCVYHEVPFFPLQTLSDPLWSVTQLAYPDAMILPFGDIAMPCTGPWWPFSEQRLRMWHSAENAIKKWENFNNTLSNKWHEEKRKTFQMKNSLNWERNVLHLEGRVNINSNH